MVHRYKATELYFFGASRRTAVQIRLLPEQEILFWKSAGVASLSYNYYINAKEEVY